MTRDRDIGNQLNYESFLPEQQREAAESLRQAELGRAALRILGFLKPSEDEAVILSNMVQVRLADQPTEVLRRIADQFYEFEHLSVPNNFPDNQVPDTLSAISDEKVIEQCSGIEYIRSSETEDMQPTAEKPDSPIELSEGSVKKFYKLVNKKLGRQEFPVDEKFDMDIAYGMLDLLAEDAKRQELLPVRIDRLISLMEGRSNADTAKLTGSTPAAISQLKISSASKIAELYEQLPVTNSLDKVSTSEIVDVDTHTPEPPFERPMSEEPLRVQVAESLVAALEFEQRDRVALNGLLDPKHRGDLTPGKLYVIDRLRDEIEKSFTDLTNEQIGLTSRETGRLRRFIGMYYKNGQLSISEPVPVAQQIKEVANEQNMAGIVEQDINLGLQKIATALNQRAAEVAKSSPDVMVVSIIDGVPRLVPRSKSGRQVIALEDEATA